MGMIRKTMSIGTLGMISFRSKKERLRRAERLQGDAEAALQDEHAARVAAESRIAMAEKRVKQTRAEAAQASKRLAEAKRRNRRARKGETVGEILAGLEPLVRSGAESARECGHRGDRTESAGRPARAQGCETLAAEREGDGVVCEAGGRTARRAPRQQGRSGDRPLDRARITLRTRRVLRNLLGEKPQSTSRHATKTSLVPSLRVVTFGYGAARDPRFRLTCHWRTLRRQRRYT